MTWVKIGEAYTDNNGVATLPYTGTGRGVVRGLAKSTVDERIIQSEVFSVWDTIFYDEATSNNPNNNWDSTVDFNRESDGTTYTAQTWVSRFIKPNNSIDIPLMDGLTYTFEVLDVSSSGGSVMTTVRDSTGFRNMNISAIGSYKVILTDKVRMYREGVTNPLYELSYEAGDSAVKIGVVGSSGSPSMKFKEFKVYYG